MVPWGHRYRYQLGIRGKADPFSMTPPEMDPSLAFGTVRADPEPDTHLRHLAAFVSFTRDGNRRNPAPRRD